MDGRTDGEDRKTQAWLDVICAELREGGSLRSAAALASRSYQWLRNWRQSDPDVDQQITSAIHTWESEAVKRISRDPDWRAPAWLLARRFPDDYGEKSTVDLNVYDAGKAKLEAQRLLGLDVEPADADDED